MGERYGDVRREHFMDLEDIGRQAGGSHMRTSCALSRSGNPGTRSVFGVPLDRFHHQEQLVDTADFAPDAMRHQGFLQVIGQMNWLGEAGSHEKDGTRAVFRPVDQR